MRPLVLVVLMTCTVRDVPCTSDVNCDLAPHGVCSAAVDGAAWCSYPDDNCPSGYRFSVDQVAAGTAGQCVPVGSGGPGSDGGGVGGVTGISCKDLPETCGANGIDSCCRSLPVPAGSYYRSFDAAADSASGAQTAPASLSAFQLDKYEVTVGRFRRFASLGLGTQLSDPVTGEGAHVKITGSGWQSGWDQHLEATTADMTAALRCDTQATWTDAPGDNEQRPINCLTWYEAFAFCAWDGGYLPTEAEWNYAAAGGDQQRVYAWSVPASSTAVTTFYASYNCLADDVSTCELQDIVPVGTLPMGDGRWGQSDLTGNVMEWQLDIYGPYMSQCTDCATIDGAADQRVARGGSYATDPLAVRSVAKLRTGFRGAGPLPTARSSTLGVRCARPL